MKAIVKSLLTLVLVAAIGLVGCSGAGTGTGLTGSYQQDTALVVESMKAAVELPQGSPNQTEVRELARRRINDYTGRYRRDTKVAG
ncbi:MAG: photosystem II protein Psb27, partial [Cyanobacteria bacterium J06641_5]